MKRKQDSAAAAAAAAHTLTMTWCTGITDAAFVHLQNIHTLDMLHAGLGVWAEPTGDDVFSTISDVPENMRKVFLGG